MGRLQSAHPSSKATVDHPFAPPANLSPTRSRPNLSGAGTPSSPPAVSPLLEKALEANTTSPSFAKSLNGLAQVGDSLTPLNIEKRTAYSGDNIIGDDFDGRVEAPGGKAIASSGVGLSYGVVPSRTRNSKGNVNVGTKLPPSGPPANLIEPERPRATTDNYRNFGSRQGATRTPTSKALLVTADSAPPPGGEQLDYTANDSERLEKCLKSLGFKPEHIKVIKAVGTEFLTYEAFMGGLDFLFSDAVDGDVLVMLVSMHAVYIKSRGVYLKFVGPDKAVVFVGARDLVVLDICHAAGLIKCKYIIRQMESKTVVVSTIVETDVPPSVETSPLLLTGNHRNEADISVGHISLGKQQTNTNTSKHINQAVVASPSPLPGPVIGSASTRNCNPVVRVLHSIFTRAPPLDLQTASDILVWVAAKEGQDAHESTLGSENGALVDAICQAIEKHGCLSREEVFDRYVSDIIEEENAAQAEWVKLQSAEAQDELQAEPQEAQLLSNCGFKKRILKGNIFQAVPKA
ncbi:hypothetical protein FRC10_008632 [Ceratobasidium sp. 414]|nr:hypothetical protein FRC10_008632 [Ceratobasidium sp. 414]